MRHDFEIYDKFTESLDKINESLVFQWLSGSHPLQIMVFGYPYSYLWFGLLFHVVTKLTLTCSKSTMKTLEKGVKCVKN